MADLTGWPISVADARSALGVTDTSYDDNDLTLYCQAACERIDQKTGRDPNTGGDAAKWVKDDGSLPVLFTLAARETVKLWWQQANTGPRAFRSGDTAELLGPPMGAELPRKVEGWLSEFLPEPGIA